MATREPLHETTVHSLYAYDPEFTELLRMFAGALAARKLVLREYLQHGDFSGLQRAAHQLRGSAGGYGYPVLSDLAATLEVAAADEDPVAAAGVLDDIVAQIDNIVGGVCSPGTVASG